MQFVCSCAPVAKGPVASDAVADAFESKWDVLWLEDCGYRPALRQTTRFAMTPLHERAGSVHPPSFFFSRAIRYARTNKTSWASEWDQFEKLLSKHLEGLVLVRFVGGSANDAGTPAEVTNFLIGRTKDGHLAGFFLDRDVWE